jgi:hypothetical protein
VKIRLIRVLHRGFSLLGIVLLNSVTGLLGANTVTGLYLRSYALLFSVTQYLNIPVTQ